MINADPHLTQILDEPLRGQIWRIAESQLRCMGKRWTSSYARINVFRHPVVSCFTHASGRDSSPWKRKHAWIRVSVHPCMYPYISASVHPCICGSSPLSSSSNFVHYPCSANRECYKVYGCRRYLVEPLHGPPLHCHITVKKKTTKRIVWCRPSLKACRESHVTNDFRNVIIITLTAMMNAMEATDCTVTQDTIKHMGLMATAVKNRVDEWLVGAAIAMEQS